MGSILKDNYEAGNVPTLIQKAPTGHLPSFGRIETLVVEWQVPLSLRTFGHLEKFGNSLSI